LIKVHSIIIFSVFLLFSLPPTFGDESENTTCTENCSNVSGTENSSDIERPNFYKIINPDVHINFSNSTHWEGLSSAGDYWNIKNGEGHFLLNAEIKQLNSATFDLNPLLESDVGDDWVLRYKLKIDNYEQGTNSKWSELLIGLFSESVNGLTPQWGVGAAFLNGDDTKYTNLMYGFGTYNEWHCCPMKGMLENTNSLPGKNKIWWVEYVKDGDTFTVRLFEDNDFRKLIEQKSFTGWTIDGLRFLKIFPLVEDNYANGHMYGRIDDIKFYNHETTVYQPDKKPIPDALKPKSYEDMLKEAYGSDYAQIEPIPEEIYTSSIPAWFKEKVSLWANDQIPNNEFYNIVKDLVINDKMLVEELSLAYGQKLDITYKPQTIEIPKDKICSVCILEKFVNLTWEIPKGLPKTASAIVEITSPQNEITKFTTSSKEGLTYRVTSDFSPGLYQIMITYGNHTFEISPILLTHDEIPKIPFWVKYNSSKWVNGELEETEFIDSLIFLIQNGEITFNHSIFVKKESQIITTPQEKLEEFFPSHEEIKEISSELPPPLWEYLVTSDALRLVNMDYVSVQKILEDRTRTFDPIYKKYAVPFTMIQMYEFDSNEIAKEFIEEQIWTNNVLIKGTVTDDELSYSDYMYQRIFENADMSGTSEFTGDCLYYMTNHAGGAVMDETHFLQCVLNEKVIQIYLYEDYHIIDKKFTFDLMDIILKKINNKSGIESVNNVLQLDNIVTTQSTSQPSTSQPSTSQPSTSQPSTSSQPKIDSTDPEISGTTVGIHNFVCKKDDFGTITLAGQFVNGQNSFEKVKVDISIESYNGSILAYGTDYVLKINPYETRTIDGYVFVEEPFHKCNATIDWKNSQ